MSENEKDWFVELGLTRDRERIMEWGYEKFPHLSKNKNLIAQLWYTQVLGKVLPTPQTIVSVEELRKKAKEFADAGQTKTDDGKDKRVWGSIEVIMVGPLGDGRPYFGCPKCLRSVDKNIGVCINEEAHPGEQIEGQMLTWQNWQAGDSTGEVIVTFAPNNKQTPHTVQGNVLTLSGSLSLRDGRYTVWEIIKNKALGVSMGTELKNTTKDAEVEANPESEISEPENIPEPEEISVGEIVVDQITEEGDESAFEESEDDDVGAEVFAELGEVVEETGDITAKIDGIDSLEKKFKNALKRYVGKKVVKVDVMQRWLLVQPQLRALPNNEELAKEFLTLMEEKKFISVDDEDNLKNLVGV
jgi:hypothetical protein